MAYVPPVGSGLVFELAGGGAYTAPSGGGLVFEMASGGLGGTISFVSSVLQIHVTAFNPPAAKITHQIPTALLSVSGAAPVNFIGKKSDSPTASVHVTAHAPTGLSIKATEVPSASLAVIGWSVTSFNGLTQPVEATAFMHISAYAPVFTKFSYHDVPPASLSVSAYAPRQRLAAQVPTALTDVQGYPPIHVVRIAAGLEGKYHAPYMTLDVTADVAVTAPAPSYSFRLHASVAMGYEMAAPVYSSLDVRYTNRVGAVCESAFTVYGLLPSSIESTYDVSLVDALRASVESSYGYSVQTSVTGRYAIAANTRVVAAVSGAYTIQALSSVKVGITAPYTLQIQARVPTALVGQYTVELRVPVRGSLRSQYGLLATSAVASAIQGSYGLVQQSRVFGALRVVYLIEGRLPVRASVGFLFSLASSSRVSGAVAGQYTIGARSAVRGSVVGYYSAATNSRIVGACAGSFSYRAVLSTALVGGFRATDPIVAALSGEYGLRERTTVSSAVRAVWSMPGSYVASLEGAPYIRIGADIIDISGGDVSCDEGSHVWQGNFSIARLEDYSKFQRDEEFTVHIYGDTYHFIVDSKELDRDAPEGYQAKVVGVSPAARYATPRQESADFFWDTATSAAAVAQELIPGIDWQLVDFEIPAYRLGTNGTTAIEVVRTLAEAVGGVVESNIDGTMYVRRKYPVSVPAYLSALPDHVLLELQDITAVSESYAIQSTFNRVVVGDTDASMSDALEWIPDYDAAQTGIVRATLQPWRMGVRLWHTGIAVTIEDPEVLVREEEELVEVFKNEGSTRFPIYSITSVEWEATDLGSLLFLQDRKEFSVAGEPFNGLVRVKYQTRSLDYRVDIASGRPTQFLLESAAL